MDKVKDELDVIMRYSNTGDDVSKIYRNNIKSKERYRQKYHRLPFQNIPKVMIMYLDLKCSEN